MKNQVSIILVSYNTRELTKNCLKSIYEQTKGVDFDIFIVDNNSEDGSQQMIKEEFPQVTLIESNENLGFGRANNVAIKQSNAKYVFLLNTDTILLNNSVKILYDFMEKEENKNIAACGGNLFDENKNHTFSHGVFLSPWSKFLKTFGLKYLDKKTLSKLKADYTNKNSELKEVEFICGADLMMRKSILDKIGLFDEKFFLYYEETELQHRMKEKGYKIFIVPEAEIMHLESASSKNLVYKKQLFLQSEYYYLTCCFAKNIFEKFLIKMIYLTSLFIKLLQYPKMTFKTYWYIIKN